MPKAGVEGHHHREEGSAGCSGCRCGDSLLCLGLPNCRNSELAP